MTPVRTTSFALLALAFATYAAPAIAQDKTACLDAASKAQKLRNAHTLVEAREQLRICSAATCPAAVQSDCAGWLADVERSLPTVVVSAKNRSGADLFDVKVTVDTAALTSKLNGEAVPMNPGPHAFHFETADGAVLDQQVMVREGEKNQEVAVVLGTASPTAPAAPAVPPPMDQTAASTPPEAQPAGGAPWKTVGWITGAVGVVGLGVGATFGFIAMHDKSTAGCDSNAVCKPGTVDPIKSAALVSDIGWIAGGVLLAGGAALVLFAPSGHENAATAVRIAPTLAPGGAGAVVGGAW